MSMNKNEILGILVNYATWEERNETIEFGEELTKEEISYILDSFNSISKVVKLEFMGASKQSARIFRLK